MFKRNILIGGILSFFLMFSCVFAQSVENLPRIMLPSGTDDNEVRNVKAIYVGPGGVIYIGSARNNRVQVFSSNGQYLRSMPSVGRDDIEVPQDIDVSKDGSIIYVVDREREVVVVGAGALGSALINYPGFEERGFRIAGVFDNNPAKIGHRLRGYEVMPFDRLREALANQNVSVGIIAVPRTAAQDVADALIEAGVRGIVNFAPVTLKVPDDVVVRSVDLTLQLETVAFHLEC